MQAGELFCDEVGGALLLVGTLLGGGGVLLRGGRHGAGGAGDDEDFFELGEVGRGLDGDGGVGLVLGVGFDGLDCADGDAAREDEVAAGGDDLLAGLDAGVGGEVVDLDAAAGGAAKDAADAGRGEDDAGSGAGIGDEQDLRGMGEDVADFAYDAVGCDDGLLGAGCRRCIPCRGRRRASGLCRWCR